MPSFPMTTHSVDFLPTIEELFSRRDKKANFTARQLMFLTNPLSTIVEHYLQDNEGQLQKLDKFPMMKFIYDNMPQQLLLKCSRKTLKSTLLSNIITINMIRYNRYHMLYMGPNEKFTKYFSNNYLAARFSSPAIQRIIEGLRRNDVFEKILKDTESSVLLNYASDDATRVRGPATDHNIHDEVQDMMFDMLPIVKETMTLSKFKREMFAGTPLTTDNTLNCLWKRSNQIEWFTKCLGCGHWNSLTEANEPLKMILPAGLSCSKCSKILDTSQGLWVETNPNPNNEITGFHLAQPILPHFNQDPKEWKVIYRKVNDGKYGVAQVFNEVFGIAYDIGSKPITEEQLKALCQLGEMKGALERHRKYYQATALGADWGVNMSSSRTACCHGGLRSDGIIEVFFGKIYKDFNYEAHVYDMAERSNELQSFNASDAGPSPDRGIKLASLTSRDRTQLVQYSRAKYIQYTETPPNAYDWSQQRWMLHRSDTMTYTFDMLKKGRILFPRWEDMSECMQDILSVFVEVKDTGIRQELVYCHNPDNPDDFMHALNFCVMQLMYWAGDMALRGPSTTSAEPSDLHR